MIKFHCYAAALLGALLCPQVLADQPACPATDFATFWQAYSQNPELQRAFTRDRVSRLQLKPSGEDFAPVADTVASTELAFPLVQPVQVASDAVRVTVEGHTAEVVDLRAGLNAMRIYGFRQQQCWRLERLEDWSIDERDLKVTDKPGMNREQRVCELRGDGFLSLAGLEAYPLTLELFDAGLQNYLCAAQSGDPQINLQSASLSMSQMATYLGYGPTEQLLLVAAKQLPAAGMFLASFYCAGGDSSSRGEPCEAPMKARAALAKAASMGDADALQMQAEALEQGRFGAPEPARAIACYQAAAAAGDAASKQALVRLGVAPQAAAAGVSCN